MKRARPKSWQECIGTRVGTQVDTRVDTRVDTGLGTRIHELCHGGESVPRTEQLYTVSACVQARVARYLLLTQEQDDEEANSRRNRLAHGGKLIGTRREIDWHTE